MSGRSRCRHVAPKAGIDQTQLINRLNRFNFKQEPLFVHLHHKLHDNILIRRAIPQPCVDEELDCRGSIPKRPTTPV